MTAPLYQIDDPAFSQLIVGSALLDQLHSGCRWAEGPVWFDDLQCLLFSDIPNQRILRWTADAAGGGAVSTFRQPSHFSNGQTRDRQGRLVTCEHGLRRVTRTEVDGSLTVLAETYQGKRLNSPNDVVVHSDGSLWFTDPTYGILSDYEGYRCTPEQPVRGVYRIDGTSGEIACVVGDFNQPNGLAFSPDERTLYIADSGASHDDSNPRHIRAFDVHGARLSNNREFALIDAGIPDGIRTDLAGNLWSSAADGVHCFAPDGHRLGKILVPEAVANLTFGGPRRNRLFITATTSLYAIYVSTTGAQRP
ncbi:SMP-30/gluconolactonase/LRE family protein [Pseudotabrizicola sp.]|uniref:SMP-30/gluconolactonase/LRE family protein n=1 Tax=Pseudotabrizicola sp. TaxID=2939647 RepID=UPI0027202805|nr:SMP-30/gluconolactonase/LRE family protein [Pseudotabrizicola sp.]MDO8884190.1 SMP-30/gluconolactonase/LRE family protein [Pseudotabrizicola sp.]